MKRDEFTSLNIVSVRERVLFEGNCKLASVPWDPSNDPDLLQIAFLIITYIALIGESGIEPYPDRLRYLGWPGQVLHELFCRTHGMWEAFRRLVERSHGLPWRTSLIEGGIVLQSVPERFVYRSLVAVSGVTRVETHPAIPGGAGRRRADFLVAAATGLSVYVELAMVSSQADEERPFPARYRGVLLQKVEFYKEQGFDPLVIWADQVASPRALAERLNDLRAQLNLPTRPPAPLAWYEEIR